jgi:putative transposase
VPSDWLTTLCLKYGQSYADGLRRRPRPGGKRNLDEAIIKINGAQQHLRKAVDQDGTVLDMLILSKRGAKTAKRSMTKLIKKQRCAPRMLVTDKLRSCGVTHSEPMCSVKHRSHKHLTNPEEIAHRPTRWRE